MNTPLSFHKEKIKMKFVQIYVHRWIAVLLLFTFVQGVPDSTEQQSPQKHFIPALAYSTLTDAYDWVVEWTCDEVFWRPKVAENISFNTPNPWVLDIGCGTGSQLLHLVSQFPEGVKIYGLDPDPQALSIAKQKLAEQRSGSPLSTPHLVNAYGDDMPFKNNSFDLVTSSLLFHHLTRTGKAAVLKEVRRVLKPSGVLRLVDWYVHLLVPPTET